jgi:membrane-associated HD superfamily phosphohydrolase
VIFASKLRQFFFLKTKVAEKHQCLLFVLWILILTTVALIAQLCELKEVTFFGEPAFTMAKASDLQLQLFIARSTFIWFVIVVEVIMRQAHNFCLVVFCVLGWPVLLCLRQAKRDRGELSSGSDQDAIHQVENRVAPI